MRSATSSSGCPCVDLIPAHRLGNPAGAGELGSFLASDEASYVTGACATIGGGLTSLPAG